MPQKQTGKPFLLQGRISRPSQQWGAGQEMSAREKLVKGHFNGVPKGDEAEGPVVRAETSQKSRQSRG